MVDVDFYEVLDVTPQASTSEIRDAYRRAVRAAHPDVGGSAGLFRLVTQAYETLSDPDARAAYDARMGRYGTPTTENDGSENLVDNEAAANWDFAADWGEEVSTSDVDETLFRGRLGQFRKWAITEAADQGIKIGWVVVVVSYVFLSVVIVATPDVLRPEAARPDLYGWLTQHWWVTLIFVFVYVFFTYPTGRSLGGMNFWRLVGAAALVAWLLAYSDIATKSDVSIYIGVVCVWIFHHAATIFINEVGEARYLVTGE